MQSSLGGHPWLLERFLECLVLTKMVSILYFLPWELDAIEAYGGSEMPPGPHFKKNGLFLLQVQAPLLLMSLVNTFSL